MLANNNELLLQRYLAFWGPVAVCLQVTNGLVNYKSGVYYDSQRRDKILRNHCALVVGAYGSSSEPDGQMEFWLIKNSWDVDWGEQGYLRLARNRNNHRGITTLPSFIAV